MKSSIKVRKIPLEDIITVLLEIRDTGAVHVDFKCILTPGRDSIHVSAYGAKNPNEVTREFDTEKEQHEEYIKRIIEGHGRN
jgi:hypothetical protein